MLKGRSNCSDCADCVPEDFPMDWNSRSSETHPGQSQQYFLNRNNYMYYGSQEKVKSLIAQDGISLKPIDFLQQ